LGNEKYLKNVVGKLHARRSHCTVRFVISPKWTALGRHNETKYDVDQGVIFAVGICGFNTSIHIDLLHCEATNYITAR
jgi:hypothetical protein